MFKGLATSCCVFTLLSAPAAADTLAESDSHAGDWRVGGFGTLGLTYHEADNFRFRRSIEQPEGVQNGTLGTNVDSSAGLQIDGQLNNEWSVMAQGVSRQRARGNWNPSLNWAFVKYVPNDDLVLRLGRLSLDLYLDGDSRHVGYAFTTVRPAPLVYGLMTFDTYDGAEVSMRHRLGKGDGWLKFYGGRGHGEASLLNYYELPKATTLGITYEWSTQDLVLSATWAQIFARDDDTFTPLANSLRHVGSVYGIPQATQRASEIDDSAKIRFAAAGIGWEHGPFSLKGIISRMEYQAFPDYKGWISEYTAAYRAGKWKPYATYARSIIDATDRPLQLPAALAPLASRYQQAVTRLLDDEYTFGLGVRYDVSTNTALKFQFDHIKAKRSLMQLDDRGLPVRNAQANLFTVTLDYVF